MSHFFGIFLSCLFVILHWTEKHKQDHVENIFFLFKDIIMNLGSCKTEPWFSHQELKLHAKEWGYKLSGAVKSKRIASSEK